VLSVEKAYPWQRASESSDSMASHEFILLIHFPLPVLSVSSENNTTGKSETGNMGAAVGISLLYCPVAKIYVSEI